MSNVDALMQRLESVVSSFKLQIAQSRRAKEWRVRPLLEEAVIPRLNEVLEAKLAESGNLHELGASRDEPKDIVHYTKLPTLIAILENQSKAKEVDQAKADYTDQVEAQESYLRMYDTFHLNDPEEGQLLIRHLSQRDREGWFALNDISHAYVASFIIPDDRKNQERGDQDNLKYWLAYGQRGRGCSIRFPVSSNRFRRVVYGRQCAKRTVRTLDLHSVWNLLKPLMDREDQAFSGAATEILSEQCGKISRKFDTYIRMLHTIMNKNAG